MGIDQIRGQVTAKKVNAVTKQLAQMTKLTGGSGVLIRERTERVIMLARRLSGFKEPAIEIDVLNDGDAAIDALKPAGICESFITENGDLLLNDRALRVVEPKAEFFSNFVITTDKIHPGHFGRAWIGGVVPVKMIRWFDEKAIVNHLDLRGAEDTLHDNVIGAMRILWEEDHDGEEEHFAVALFDQNYIGLRFAGNLDFGEVAIGTEDATGLDGEGFLDIKTPDADLGDTSVINISGDSSDGVKGIATAGVCIAKLEEAGVVDRDFGPEDGTNTLVKDEVGYKIIGDLGSRGGASYAVVRPFRPRTLDVETVYSIDEQAPNTESADDGTIAFDEASGDEKHAVFKFRKPTLSLFGLLSAFTSAIVGMFDVDNFIDFGSFTLTCRVRLIVDAVDSLDAPVTWNTVNALTFRETRDFKCVVTVTDAFPNESGTDHDVTVALDDELTAIYTRDGFLVSDADRMADKKIVGARVQAFITSYNMDATITGTADTDTATKRESACYGIYR